MTARAIHWQSWQLAEESDRAFQRLLLLIFLPILAFMIALPFLDLVGLQRGGGTLAGPRFVELISEREDATLAETTAEAAPEEQQEPDPVEPEAPPEPEVTPPEPVVAPPRPVPTAAPVPQPAVDPALAQQQAAERAAALARQQARQQAQVFDQLSALRDPTLSGLDAAQPLTSTSVVGTAGGSGAGSGAVADPSRIAQTARQSQGVRDPGVGDTRRTDQGTGLARRNTTQVESPVGFGEDRSRPGQSGDRPIAGRTLQEIQLVFDRNKGAFTAIVNRALRTNPNLRGKIVVSFIIQPDGSVSDLVLINSELGDADVERQLLTRIQLINFGAKNVPPFPVRDYPIVLL